MAHQAHERGADVLPIESRKHCVSQMYRSFWLEKKLKFRQWAGTSNK